MKSGISTTWLDAITRMLGYIAPVFKNADSHIWRAQVGWQEECDLAIKRQYKTVQKLYDKYSGKFALPGSA